MWSLRRVRFLSCGTIAVAFAYTHPDASVIAFSDANSSTRAESYTRASGTNIHCYWCRP
jgi:hypothetical protein